MNGKENNILFSNITKNYIKLENLIQGLINHISGEQCKNCLSICCKEEICRETINSCFLSLVIKKNQSIEYDYMNGWVSNEGCRLKNGRPLVCYEFFCDKLLIHANHQMEFIRYIINEFVLLGKNSHGNIHLICIDDVSIISRTKLLKINKKITSLITKTADKSLSLARERQCEVTEMASPEHVEVAPSTGGAVH